MNSEKTFCVYKHTCPNLKYYFGITSQNPKYRWANGNGYKECPLFWNAIQKYGWDNIKHEILYTGLTEQKAKDMERKLIAEYKSNDRRYGYNITAGGDGSLGRKQTEETKMKISIAQRSKHPSEEARLRMSKAQKGRKHSEETRQKISKSHMGNTNQKTRKIVQLDKDTGDVINVWDRIIDAVRALGKNKNSNIFSVLEGKTKTAYGFKWMYYEDYMTSI